MIHTLPAVARIKRARPDWHLSWLINTEWAPLLAGNLTVDEIVPFPRSRFRKLSGLIRFARWSLRVVRPRRTGLAIDFQGLLRTALIAKISGASRIFGLNDARECADLLYTDTISPSQPKPHSVERYLALADSVLADGENCRDGLEFPLPPGTAPEGADRLADCKYVLLHPFARGNGKSLTAGQIDQICQRLLPDRQIVVVGRSPAGETPYLRPECINSLDRTNLNELIWLIRHAGFVIR